MCIGVYAFYRFQIGVFVIIWDWTNVSMNLQIFIQSYVKKDWLKAKSLLRHIFYTTKGQNN